MWGGKKKLPFLHLTLFCTCSINSQVIKKNKQNKWNKTIISSLQTDKQLEKEAEWSFGRQWHQIQRFVSSFTHTHTHTHSVRLSQKGVHRPSALSEQALWWEMVAKKRKPWHQFRPYKKSIQTPRLFFFFFSHRVLLQINVLQLFMNLSWRPGEIAVSIYTHTYTLYNT